MALIARAAQGSLRDGLSLLDQAIAFGGGEVQEDVVRTMLGTVDRDYVYRIADALADGDGPALLARERCARRPRPGVRARTGGARVAVPPHRGGAGGARRRSRTSTMPQRVAGYAGRFSPETVQLHYQIAAQGRADLALAPDEATGCHDDAAAHAGLRARGRGRARRPRRRRARRAARRARRRGARRPRSRHAPASASRRDARAPVRAALQRSRTARRRRSRAAATATPAAGARRARDATRAAAARPRGDGRRSSRSLKLIGHGARSSPRRPSSKAIDGQRRSTLALPVAHKHLADTAYSDKLKVALEQATGRKLLLAFEVGAPTEASLAATRAARAGRGAGDSARRPSARSRSCAISSRASTAQVKSETIAPLARERANPIAMETFRP